MPKPKRKGEDILIAVMSLLLAQNAMFQSLYDELSIYLYGIKYQQLKHFQIQQYR